MGRRSENGHVTTEKGGTDEALREALQLRSAQRITDLRAPLLRATGTERISQMLADARQERDREAEARLERDRAAEARPTQEPEHPRGARLPSWVPPLGRGEATTGSSSAEVG